MKKKQLSVIFRRRIVRFALIYLVLCLIGSYTYWYEMHEYVEPGTVGYWYTTTRSTNHPMGLDVELFPDRLLPSFQEEGRKKFSKLCNSPGMSQNSTTIYIKIYRGAVLCNSARIESPEYGGIENAFTKLVDDEYNRYYIEIVSDITFYAVIAFVVWLTSLLVWLVVKWAWAGESSRDTQ